MSPIVSAPQKVLHRTTNWNWRKRTRSVSRRLIEAQEQERTRIARDLHDDIGQRLALLAIESRTTPTKRLTICLQKSAAVWANYGSRPPR